MNTDNVRVLAKELVRDEGLRLQAYKDSVGLWTIGVGHLIGEDPGRPGQPRVWLITEPEAMAWLTMDIEIAYNVGKQFVPDLLYWGSDAYGSSMPPSYDESVRWRAIVNMAFNLGPRLGQFKNFLAAVNQRDWPVAADHMMQSKWATQVGKRAERLRDMILTGKVAA